MKKLKATGQLVDTQSGLDSKRTIQKEISCEQYDADGFDLYGYEDPIDFFTQNSIVDNKKGK